ncbi:MAG TPA: LolA-related protein [Steroidobacteraceae bacterium]|nr:LolA-related protein [Steroidobacteraceae bacterium]
MLRALPLMLLSLCCALGSIPAHADAAGDGDLDQVMGLLAMRKHGRVEFIEQQFLAVLKRPLESSGELSFDAPDRLEKRTLKPRPETLLLTGATLTVERAHRRRVMDLHAYPQVLPFIESIRATLAGDRAALERLFHLDFTGSVARWTLTLVPLKSKMEQSVAQLRIDGAGDQLLKIEIRQPDGDRSLMTLRPSTLP